MDCDATRARLDALVDRELEASDAQAIEEHLATCGECAAAYAERRAVSGALRAMLPTYRAPDVMRARLRRALREAEAEAAPRAARTWRWMAGLAAALLVAISLGTFALVGTSRVSGGDALIAHDVLASHVRSLQPGHLMDVASTDQHTVKPWFDGRIDFAPPVVDPSAAGYPLIGGRLDWVGDRPVAALVYQRRKHVINCFVWPTTERDAPVVERSERGYHLLHWRRAGMTYWLASDLGSAELRELAGLLMRTP